VASDPGQERARPPEHRSVMRKEVLAFLAPRPAGVYVDATIGLGGHAEALLEADPTIRVVGIDRDAEALELARSRLARFGDRVRLVHGNYRDLDGHLARLGISEIDGLLLDLGLSSFQLDSPERGFSFRAEGPIDMRMDRSVEGSALDLVNRASPEGLERILRSYGEERFSSRIARSIAQERARAPIETTEDLARIVRAAIPRRFHPPRIDAATRTFQALRIAVNAELESLADGLRIGFSALRIGGVLVAISYHSLEDRAVKAFFRERALPCTCPPDLPVCVCGKRVEAQILTPRPVLPSPDEVVSNSRSRSAKLRAARKVI
jgi:16S rRNA (cytosine1402-N4)-methyltransferase